MEEAEKYSALYALIPSLSEKIFTDLLAYERLLLKWQKSINLIAQGAVLTFWQRHILDSAQLYPLKSKASLWYDLGSGGGMPALVLAIFLKHRGGGKVHLIESNGKKVAFLRHVGAELALPIKVHHGRIEVVRQELPCPEVITARALAPFNQLLALSAVWINQGATTLWQKGCEHAAEICQARAEWDFELQIYHSEIDPKSVILDVGYVRPKDGCDEWLGRRKEDRGGD
ncbi:16S rRNA (guanine(527)-N(7))-methyltransferase RsmG [Bartonella sp. DGB2]|uniref:16S rRNA (guanine(527)-N(7))-methyltransferase RsmG n=1 Tax=Bartonella sp. DGB2 TaxID=3388426 RepID=UPI0039900197